MAPRWIVACAALLAVCACGRKLPPVPPEAEEPVRLVEAGFRDGAVEALVHCRFEGKVSLLGKPKDDCPRCTETLVTRDERAVSQPGDVVLRDADPAGDAMVYRALLESGHGRWYSNVRIIERPRAPRAPGG